MKLRINPTVVFRVPKFSYKASLGDSWGELKKSISLSSNAFFELIKDKEFKDHDILPDNLKHTLWKYFNRSRFRATPYGSFAGIGTFSIQNNTGQNIMIANDQVLHRFRDWPLTEKLSLSIEKLIQEDAYLWSNSSYYFTERDIRYIGRFGEHYELADVPQSPITIIILKACKKPLPISELYKYAGSGLGKGDFYEALESMLADQMLIAGLQPNVIGEDYFRRTSFPAMPGSPVYVIAERPCIDSKIDPNIYRHLPELIEKLHHMLPTYSSPELDTFKTNFSRKFGERAVPIMVALDPELGVGYGHITGEHAGGEIIDQLLGKIVKAKTQGDVAQSTLNLLLPHLVNNNQQAIDLDTLDMPKGLSNDPLPNSLSVLCGVADGILQIEHIGGCTANSLLGRFTLACRNIHELSRDVAHSEQKANPGIHFFDVGYLAGGVVDNVNRRASIYDHQLNILNFDTSDAPISLTDLTLSIQEGQLILFSKKLNKRLVPRLATAYNYLYSDLPLFRLLCDLQHQGIHKNIYLRLRDRLPDLPYYPRIQYRNIILSPTTWRIQLNDVSAQTGNSIKDFATHLATTGISRHTRYNAGDQTLLFDTYEEGDMDALWSVLKKQKKIFLEEVILPLNPCVFDEDGKPYLPQLLFTVEHGQEIYKSVSLIDRKDASKIEKVILPGRNWVYFEIFCHPSRADEILLEAIDPFITERKDQIKSWFFIRYNENGNHIRLRLKLSNESDTQAFIQAFASVLDSKIKAGIISDLTIRIYRREIERYGVNIFKVEDHFFNDSQYVVVLVKHSVGDRDKYKLCAALANAVQQSEIITSGIFGKMIGQNLKQFIEEHSLQPSEFKLLNMDYKKFQSDQEPILDHDTQSLFNGFIKSFINTLSQYPDHERPAIFSSLFHMHVNRLFSSVQRSHETVIYYFIEKSLKIYNQPVKSRTNERISV